MRKLYNILIIIASLLMCSPESLYGETVSRREAQNIAEMFFNAARGQKMAAPNFTFTGREFTTNRLFIPFYVFNHPTGGYVIISAENKAYPILAYSFKGKLEPGRLSAGQKALFNLYGRQIEFIRYDAETPLEAIKAWGNLPQHIYNILSSQLDVTDLLSPWTEVETEVNNLYERYDSRDLTSGNYQPSQWVTMVGDELRSQRNVVMAIATPQGDLMPAVATGRRGDYFRLRFNEQPSDAMYRLLPTEIISTGEMAILTNPIGAPEEFTAQEIPFEFYDSFIEETKREEENRRNAINEVLEPTGPIVEWQGSGQFSVYLPEEAAQAIVYNVSGMRVDERTYRDTNLAQIDLSAQPAGFYIALIRGKSGHTYSLRLYR